MSFDGTRSKAANSDHRVQRHSDAIRRGEPTCREVPAEDGECVLQRFPSRFLAGDQQDASVGGESLDLAVAAQPGLRHRVTRRRVRGSGPGYPGPIETAPAGDQRQGVVLDRDALEVLLWAVRTELVGRDHAAVAGVDHGEGARLIVVDEEPSVWCQGKTRHFAKALRQLDSACRCGSEASIEPADGPGWRGQADSKAAKLLAVQAERTPVAIPTMTSPWLEQQ
ncbi:MAG: hypothetical protein R2909_03210 [Gemmatimonadales bacterium]